jgi:glutamine amidotransferase PdxT
MKIAIFIHHPKCSVQSVNGIIQALSPNYTFKIFTKNKLEYNFFDDVDAVCFPGGIGDSESFHSLFKENKYTIKNFVRSGRKYLGICMGAYWADKYYFDIVKDLRVSQYIKRPNSDTRRPHPKAQSVVWKGKETNMFFYDGCAIHGTGLDHSKVYSLYPNGDAMALIQDNIGLIGCHPESTKYWYETHHYLKNQYHNGIHHKLLLDFVNNLMKKH